jgi:membrane protein required for colicin V production
VNEADVLILAVVGLSALLGAVRGMLTEVLSLLLWIAAFGLAFVGGDVLAGELHGIDSPVLRMLAGHIGLFVLVLLVGNILIWLLRSLVHGAGLSGADRVLGFGFGVARGLAVVLAGVLVAGFTPALQGPVWQGSRLLPLFEGPRLWLADKLPEADEFAALTVPAASYPESPETH